MDTKTAFKRLMCAAMVALTILTSAPLTGGKDNPFAVQAEAAIEGKVFGTPPGEVYPGYGIGKKIDAFYATVKGKKMGGNYQYYRGGTSKKAWAGYCHGFVCDVWYNVFGYDMYHSGKSKTTAKQKTFTESAIKNFIKKNARIGDIVRTEGSWEHSYLIREITDSSVRFYEYGGDKLYVNGAHEIKLTYKDMANRWGKGQFYGKKASYYFLYKINDDIYSAKDGIISVTFNANGGSVSRTSKYYQVGKNYIGLPTPKRSGYKFTGWYTAKTGGTKVTSSLPVEKSNKILYARWKVVDKNKLYYVQYNANGGSGSMSRIEVIANEYFLSGPNKFTKNGYTLKGWNLRRKSDNKWYISGKGWKSDKQIKLYKYDKKLFKDNYKYKLDSYWTKGSGKNDTFVLYAVWNKCTSHKWDAGKVTTAATTMKTGVKTFTCTNCKSTKTQTIAKLTTDSYFSKVYANNIKSNDAKIGAKAKSTAQKKGTGFYLGTSKDSMKRYTKNLKGKGDGAGTYTDIFFTLSGWYGKLKPGTTYYYSVFYIDKNGKECASVIKSFKTSGTASSSTATAPATKTFTYAYNANGGNGTMSSQKVELNKSFTVKANEFKRSGYTFTGYTVKRNSDGRFFIADKGWKTESEISGNKWTKKLYAPGASLNVNSSWQNGSKTNETFTFYAQWKKNGCTSHCWDGGKVTTAPTTVKTGINTHTCSECGATTTTVIERSTTEKYFSSVYANSITSTSAKIGANAKSKEQKKGTGFYLGTSKDSMKRYTKNLKGGSDAPGTYTEIFFPLNNWYGKLKSKTTYYYSILYLDKNGKECASVIKSFKTK